MILSGASQFIAFMIGVLPVEISISSLELIETVTRSQLGRSVEKSLKVNDEVELPIIYWIGKGVGAVTSHRIINAKVIQKKARR